MPLKYVHISLQFSTEPKSVAASNSFTQLCSKLIQSSFKWQKQWRGKPSTGECFYYANILNSKSTYSKQLPPIHSMACILKCYHNTQHAEHCIADLTIKNLTDEYYKTMGQWDKSDFFGQKGAYSHLGQEVKISSYWHINSDSQNYIFRCCQYYLCLVLQRIR